MHNYVNKLIPIAESSEIHFENRWGKLIKRLCIKTHNQKWKYTIIQATKALKDRLVTLSEISDRIKQNAVNNPNPASSPSFRDIGSMPGWISNYKYPDKAGRSFLSSPVWMYVRPAGNSSWLCQHNPLHFFFHLREAGVPGRSSLCGFRWHFLFFIMYSSSCHTRTSTARLKDTFGLRWLQISK